MHQSSHQRSAENIRQFFAVNTSLSLKTKTQTDYFRSSVSTAGARINGDVHDVYYIVLGYWISARENGDVNSKSISVIARVEYTDRAFDTARLSFRERGYRDERNSKHNRTGEAHARVFGFFKRTTYFLTCPH